MADRGKPLQVRQTKDSITIVMDLIVDKGRPPVLLVLRCERDGDIFASIRRDVSQT